MRVHLENLVLALSYAIRERKKEEIGRKLTSDSVLLTEWKIVRQAILDGEHLEFYYRGIHYY
jgi:hypothetical protein